MDFVKVVEGRRSIRTFLPEPVPEADIKEIIRLGMLAPSAGNRQDWRFLAISNHELKNEIKKLVQEKSEEIAEQAGEEEPEKARDKHTSILFADAPLAVVVLTRFFRSKTDEMLRQSGYAEAEIDYLRMRPDLQSIGGLIQTMLLAAHNLGYGGCWMVAPNIARHEIEKLLEIRPPWSMAALLAFGQPSKKERGGKIVKPLEQALEIIE